eukprot:COSAG01_NODE_492_length_16335_cov_63.722284_20_plen_78_part_00
MAAHVTTARVRAAVAPVLSLSALPPRYLSLAVCATTTVVLVLRSKLPWAAGCTALPAGFWKLFWNQQLDSAAGYYSV